MSQTPARFDSYGRVRAAERAPSRHPAWRERLDCRFPAVDGVFDDCLDDAMAVLDRPALEAFVDQARWFGKLGRGPEPVLAFLEAWPAIVRAVPDASLAELQACATAFQRSPNGAALAALLETLPAVARVLHSARSLAEYLALVVELMQATSISIHGSHATGPSASLPAFLQEAPHRVKMAPIDGLRRWMREGLRLHAGHPQRQIDFFQLRTADARALLQRERRGTLLVDVEHRLELTLRAAWSEALHLEPIPVLGAEEPGAAVQPALVGDHAHLPEVLEDTRGIGGLRHYRAMLAHLAGHRRWTRPLVADNLSPMQRLAVECFEDARVDALVLRRWPGWRETLLALHPAPVETACDPGVQSCLRHRLVCLSRALLDPAHPYRDPVLLRFEALFRDALQGSDSSTEAMRGLAVSWAAATRRASDQSAQVFFEQTIVPWRDDNRHLWTFIEEGDEEETLAARPPAPEDDAAVPLPPRHYPEWDAIARRHRPDWTSVFDRLQPPGQAADVDALLERHAPVARHLARLLDLLKPQDRTRLRRQEEGTELDTDAAVRALTDWRAGAQPDSRVQMSTRTDGRDMAVLLLLDLSESVNDPVPGAPGETVLTLSRAAVALLAHAVAALGDRLAIAGFQSNTRHEVRYWHIKGFSEAWDDAPKARLAGIRGAWSTRMGAGLRHAGHWLSGQRADRRLLLVLTDGQPSDVDVADPEHLTIDAGQAIRELAEQGLYTHGISLDAKADPYMSRIFGPRWTLVDRVEQLPRRLPELFLSLTR